MGNLKRLPLSAFDPRLRPLIERGCREHVVIKCDSPRQANYLRNMLNTLRARLKHEKRDQPELWEHMYGTIISMKPGCPDTVWLRPRHEEFDRLLSGLSLPTEAPALAADPLAEFDKETEK